MKKALDNRINTLSLIKSLRQHKWFLVKMMGWQPLWSQPFVRSMVSVSLGLILEGLSPGFDLDPAIMLCFLFLTVSYTCSFGNEAVLCKAWSSKAQTPCPWWGTCTTFNLHNIFCPTDYTWIRCIRTFKYFPGSCAHNAQTLKVWTHILPIRNHHACSWYNFSCDEPQLLAWVTQERSERMMWTLETVPWKDRHTSLLRLYHTDHFWDHTWVLHRLLKSQKNAVVRAEIHPSVPWCCGVEWCGVLLPCPELPRGRARQ